MTAIYPHEGRMRYVIILNMYVLILNL